MYHEIFSTVNVKTFLLIELNNDFGGSDLCIHNKYFFIMNMELIRLLKESDSIKLFLSQKVEDPIFHSWVTSISQRPGFIRSKHRAASIPRNYRNTSFVNSYFSDDMAFQLPFLLRARQYACIWFEDKKSSHDKDYFCIS